MTAKLKLIRIAILATVILLFKCDDEPTETNELFECVKETYAVKSGDAAQDLDCYLSYQREIRMSNRSFFNCMTEAKKNEDWICCYERIEEQERKAIKKLRACHMSDSCVAHWTTCSEACDPSETDGAPCYDACRQAFGTCVDWFNADCSQTCTDDWRSCNQSEKPDKERDWEAVSACYEKTVECDDACLCGGG